MGRSASGAVRSKKNTSVRVRKPGFNDFWLYPERAVLSYGLSSMTSFNLAMSATSALWMRDVHGFYSASL